MFNVTFIMCCAISCLNTFPKVERKTLLTLTSRQISAMSEEFPQPDIKRCDKPRVRECNNNNNDNNNNNNNNSNNNN